MMAQFEEQLDSWLDQVSEVPLVSNMSDADQQKIDLIDSLVVQVAVEGYGQQPDEWTPQMLADLFFNRFVRLLEENEKQQRLFELIPTAVTVLLKVVQPAHQSALMSWIQTHHNELVHLYDPVADQIYSQLTQAMEKADVDVNNSKQVAVFIRQYMHDHPDQSKTLFTKGDQQ
ncbi:hypothetical protein ACFP1H_10335 [Secundilactobacillus hailunensis]|uniref:Uncharacterized protein n=1 Tax=Secundilactobacillus hailunensis TaxID=2559923 RepID=A0ABW1TAV5_9LACO|nr:hypothetical protein [Secundilactobacillus hailunensis]